MHNTSEFLFRLCANTDRPSSRSGPTARCGSEQLKTQQEDAARQSRNQSAATNFQRKGGRNGERLRMVLPLRSRREGRGESNEGRKSIPVPFIPLPYFAAVGALSMKVWQSLLVTSLRSLFSQLSPVHFNWVQSTWVQSTFDMNNGVDNSLRRNFDPLTIEQRNYEYGNCNWNQSAGFHPEV